MSKTTDNTPLLQFPAEIFSLVHPAAAVYIPNSDDFAIFEQDV